MRSRAKRPMRRTSSSIWPDGPVKKRSGIRGKWRSGLWKIHTARAPACSGLEREAGKQISGKIGAALRREKTSVSQEDYLKAIWEMLEEDQMPISARLAEELKVTPPAVTAALKRMTRDGHVRVERSGRIDLTQKGRKRAEHLALRHQLAEMLLTEVIGLSWAKAHDEAERMEHAISPEVEALLLKRFGDKKSCPHGVPMRGGIAQL